MTAGTDHAMPVSCSGRSLAAGESLTASAPTAAAWLVLEVPGQWGPRPPVACGFGDEVVRHLQAVTALHGLRLQLIRRHTRERGRAATEGRRRYFLADVRPGHRRVLAGYWQREQDLLRLPVGALAAPARGGAAADPSPSEPAPWHEPLVLVCTHGKRDACCALYGRQVARPLEERYGERVWETTHTGGHRFAANVVLLPDGVVLGRLSRDDAVDVVRRYFDGELAAEHFRGWSYQDPWSQAAEWFARSELGLRAREGVTAVVQARDGDRATVLVEGPGGNWRLSLLRRAFGELRMVSCGKPAAEDPGEFVLEGLEPAPAVRTPAGSPSP